MTKVGSKFNIQQRENGTSLILFHFCFPMMRTASHEQGGAGRRREPLASTVMTIKSNRLLGAL